LCIREESLKASKDSWKPNDSLTNAPVTLKKKKKDKQSRTSVIKTAQKKELGTETESTAEGQEKKMLESKPIPHIFRFGHLYLTASFT
jgi:hypothetical protein